MVYCVYFSLFGNALQQRCCRVDITCTHTDMWPWIRGSEWEVYIIQQDQYLLLHQCRVSAFLIQKISLLEQTQWSNLLCVCEGVGGYMRNRCVFLMQLYLQNMKYSNIDLSLHENHFIGIDFKMEPYLNVSLQLSMTLTITTIAFAVRYDV